MLTRHAIERRDGIADGRNVGMAGERHNAFVSGAGRNIGRAVALELARRGCNLVINGYRNRAICEAVAAAASALGVETEVLIGDVGDAGEAGRLAEAALARFGTIDILVNNAAIRPHQKFLEISDADWHRVVAVDLDAAMYLSRAFLPGMIAQGWGRIVNFTGLNAILGNPAGAHISAAKHGVLGLTKALAREFGPHGITVNAISPGPIAADGEDVRSPRREAAIARVPLGRQGTNEEIAAVCGMLCSQEGAYVSGQMIAVSGGGVT
jgi:3-oxoacyl-[acyl-carrier protein] reductase